MMKTLDRLLRDTLRGRRASPVGPCLDAETAAGWFDDSLDSGARTAAEAHVANCVRCQALLAAMVRTAPPAVAHPWGRAAFMRWLVPLATASTAVLVLLNLPGRTTVPHTPADTRGAAQPAERLQARTENPSADATVPPRADREGPASTSNAQPTDARRKTKAFSSMRGAVEDGSPARATPDAAPQPAAPSVAVSGSSSAALAETVGGASRQRAAPRLMAARRETAIASPDALSQWRIGAAGTVSHSMDGGATWETQTTGVTTTLTAGASPSPSVCWLVGEAGVVLITIDGRSWQRLAFPEVVNLVAVRATDDRVATVTTADGRSFNTSDRGQTWTAR